MAWISVSTSTDGHYSALTYVMKNNWLCKIFQFRTAILLIALGTCSLASSQEVSAALVMPEPMVPTPMAMAVHTSPLQLPEAPSHRFWDRENSVLFAAAAAFNTADFVVTRNNLRNGGRELNPVTRVFSGSTGGLAVNFAGETAGVAGLSYFFHKTGHHKLERIVYMVNISSSAAAVTFDLAHR